MKALARRLHGFSAAAARLGCAAVLLGAAACSKPDTLPERIADFASAWNRGALGRIERFASDEDRASLRLQLAQVRRGRDGKGACPQLSAKDTKAAMQAAESAAFAARSRFDVGDAFLDVSWIRDEHFEHWELVRLSLTAR